jgi:hypothetical protein
LHFDSPLSDRQITSDALHSPARGPPSFIEPACRAYKSRAAGRHTRGTRPTNKSLFKRSALLWDQLSVVALHACVHRPVEFSHPSCARDLHCSDHLRHRHFSISIVRPKTLGRCRNRGCSNLNRLTRRLFATVMPCKVWDPQVTSRCVVPLAQRFSNSPPSLTWQPTSRPPRRLVSPCHLHPSLRRRVDRVTCAEFHAGGHRTVA